MRLSFGHIISFVAGAVACAALVIGDAPQLEPASDLDVVRPAQQGIQHESQRVPRRAEQLPTHETVECCLKVAEDIDRELARRLRQKQMENPEAFAAQLKYQGRRLLDLCELRSDDPALYNAKLLEMQYDAKVTQLAAALCDAAEQGNEQRVVDFENELLQTLRIQLLFEIKARGDFLLKLQEEVARRQSELETMGNQFDDTVKTRLAEIKDCRHPHQLSWQQQTRAVVPSPDPADIPAE